MKIRASNKPRAFRQNAASAVAASVVVISFQGRNHLPACIRSIKNDLKVQNEIIVVDNASTDGSVSLIQAEFPWVKVLANPENLGFAAACNQGAMAASGKYLVFLNQDTVVRLGWLKGLLEPLKSDSGVGLTTSKLLIMSEPDKIHMCGQDIHFTGLPFGRGFLASSESHSRPEAVGAVSGASFAIPRELWQELGGFDERLFMYFEETDLSWRARRAGYASLFVPESVVEHDFNPGKPGYLRLYYAKRNRYFLLLKNLRFRSLILLAPSLFLAEVLDWAHALSFGKGGFLAKIRALWWLLSGAPGLLREQPKNEPGKTIRDGHLLESCVSKLTPRMVTGGAVGRALVSACNAWFAWHHRVVISLSNWLGI